MLFYSRKHGQNRFSQTSTFMFCMNCIYLTYLFILWGRGRAGLVVVAVVVMGGMFVCLWRGRSVANGHGRGASHQENHNCLRNKATIIQHTSNEKAF